MFSLRVVCSQYTNCQAVTIFRYESGEGVTVKQIALI